jgi:small subunit ribosomal protein S9
MPEKKTTIKKEAKSAPKPKTVTKKAVVPEIKETEIKSETISEVKEVKEVKRDIKDAKFVGKYIAVTGKRKTASAQVRLFEKGNGAVMVNNMASDVYFDTLEARALVNSVIKSGGDIYNFTVLVAGGGKLGQAEAVRHAIAKAMIIHNPELRPVLKSKGYLTRDARKKERKKPGLKRARRAPQWSKR